MNNIDIYSKLHATGIDQWVRVITSALTTVGQLGQRASWQFQRMDPTRLVAITAKWNQQQAIQLDLIRQQYMWRQKALAVMAKQQGWDWRQVIAEKQRISGERTATEAALRARNQVAMSKEMQAAAGGATTAMAVTAGVIIATVAAIGAAIYAFSKLTQAAARYEITLARISALSASPIYATGLMQRTRSSAISLGMRPGDLHQTLQMLQAAKTPAQTLQRDLENITRLSIVSGSATADLGRIYAEVNNKGRIYREDMLQFSRRNIPIQQALRKELGVSAEELNRMVSEGRISYEIMASALDRVARSAEYFGGAIDVVSETVTGKYNRIASATVAMFEAGSGEVLQWIGEIIANTTQIDEAWQTAFGDMGVAEVFETTAEYLFEILKPLEDAVAMTREMRKEAAPMKEEYADQLYAIEELYQKQVQLNALGDQASAQQAAAIREEIKAKRELTEQSAKQRREEEIKIQLAKQEEKFQRIQARNKVLGNIPGLRALGFGDPNVEFIEDKAAAEKAADEALEKERARIQRDAERRTKEKYEAEMQLIRELKAQKLDQLEIEKRLAEFRKQADLKVEAEKLKNDADALASAMSEIAGKEAESASMRIAKLLRKVAKSVDPGAEIRETIQAVLRSWESADFQAEFRAAFPSFAGQTAQEAADFIRPLVNGAEEFKRKIEDAHAKIRTGIQDKGLRDAVEQGTMSKREAQELERKLSLDELRLKVSEQRESSEKMRIDLEGESLGYHKEIYRIMQELEQLGGLTPGLRASLEAEEAKLDMLDQQKEALEEQERLRKEITDLEAFVNNESPDLDRRIKAAQELLADRPMVSQDELDRIREYLGQGLKDAAIPQGALGEDRWKSIQDSFTAKAAENHHRKVVEDVLTDILKTGKAGVAATKALKLSVAK